MTTVLFITVGGSHEPIVTAIEHLHPDRVVFFCTDRDPETRQPGSRRLIEGAGNVIVARGDTRPTLPSIPTQCRLPADSYQVQVVPADDLDGAYMTMVAAFDTVKASEPAARLVADYTGATKTMSAALVLAALDHGAELQVVTGTRADLVKVRDGTQEAAPAQVEAVRLEREMRPLLAAWKRYAYDEAAAGLESIAVPRNRRLQRRRHRAIQICRAFAAWDRFDHAAARHALDPYNASLRPALAAQLDALRVLTHPDDRGRREGLRVWDLWLNAQRRAAAGRYDDAVARAYRMIEWTAQWVLHLRTGWRTAALPAEVARAVGIEPNRDGAYQAGLFQAWELVSRHAGGPAAAFIAAQRSTMLDLLKQRNASILAHGFDPVDRDAWTRFEAWLREHFEPLLRAELAAVGISNPFPQLPDAYPHENAS